MTGLAYSTERSGYCTVLISYAFITETNSEPEWESTHPVNGNLTWMQYVEVDDTKP